MNKQIRGISSNNLTIASLTYGQIVFVRQWSLDNACYDGSRLYLGKYCASPELLEFYYQNKQRIGHNFIITITGISVYN